MTTDTRPKTAFIREKLWGREITLAGLAKGAGMIHPDMATLLAFVFTDAALSAPVLKTAPGAGSGPEFQPRHHRRRHLHQRHGAHIGQRAGRPPAGDRDVQGRAFW